MIPNESRPAGNRAAEEKAARALSESTVDGRPDRSREAELELQKVGNRISKLADDDRFGRYARTDDGRSQIARTKELLRGLLDRLDKAEGGSR